MIERSNTFFIMTVVKIYLFLLLILSVSTTNVNYVTTVKGGGYYQNTGSIAGGTLLWIKGNGFASNGFSTQPSTATTNVVQLVKDNDIWVYPCEVASRFGDHVQI